uniref:Homeobox domain-containing protein n=1 Tax=Mesocestoides corti TaxID=53468 RepID=A0A5K3FXZ2_MESCO
MKAVFCQQGNCPPQQQLTLLAVSTHVIPFECGELIESASHSLQPYVTPMATTWPFPAICQTTYAVQNGYSQNDNGAPTYTVDPRSQYPISGQQSNYVVNVSPATETEYVTAQLVCSTQSQQESVVTQVGLSDYSSSPVGFNRNGTPTPSASIATLDSTRRGRRQSEMPRGASNGLGARKKPRKSRTIYTREQTDRLIEVFARTQYLNLTERAKLAPELGLKQTQLWASVVKPTSQSSKVSAKFEQRIIIWTGQGPTVQILINQDPT